MCLVVTCMLATCLGLTILGYHQLHRQYHPYKRGTCRLPCHMRRQQQQLQLCSRRRSSYLSQQPKEVLIGQPPQDGAALVFGDLGYGQGIDSVFGGSINCWPQTRVLIEIMIKMVIFPSFQVRTNKKTL